LVTWLVFGLACFCGDFTLHRIVDATPWLAQRPWLVEAAVVAMAGAYQLTPLKHRTLGACRHPAGELHGGGNGARAGIGHAFDCLGASGPLMLLMFAAGFANLLWMAALSVLMLYEGLGRHGQGAARVAGIALLYLALFALTNQGLPGWL
jgi:predicted metal-binding membrane protein